MSMNLTHACFTKQVLVIRSKSLSQQTKVGGETSNGKRVEFEKAPILTLKPDMLMSIRGSPSFCPFGAI